MKKILLGMGASLMVLTSLLGCGSTYQITSKEESSFVQADIVEALTTSETMTIQKKLKNWGYYTGSVDGIVGPQTAKAIGITIGTSSTTTKNTSSDLYLLAKCVYAEARGEPYQGQVAVAAVILNRVKSPNFPNTISGVIYQPWAFTSIQDGQINLEPNSTAYSAAQDALNGWDPTYGCLYYYNASTATSKWIFSRKTVVTIGKHVFAI